MDDATRTLERAATEEDSSALEGLTWDRLSSRTGSVVAWPSTDCDGATIRPPTPGVVRSGLILPGQTMPVDHWIVAVTSPEQIVAAVRATPRGCAAWLIDFATAEVVTLASWQRDQPTLRAGEGWAWPTIKIFDPRRGHVVVATWIDGRFFEQHRKRRENRQTTWQTPAAAVMRGAARAVQADRRQQATGIQLVQVPGTPIGARPTEAPLWERMVLPTEGLGMAHFFCNASTHPDGSPISRGDWGTEMRLNGCLPSHHHMWVAGVSLHADLDTDQRDLEELAGCAVEVQIGTSPPVVFARVSEFGVAGPTTGTKRRDVIDVSLGAPVVLPLGIATHPYELLGLEALRVVMHLKRGYRFTRPVGVTFMFHGLRLKPLAG